MEKTNQTNFHVIGLMSGTSLDGVDLAYCRYTLKDNWNFEVIQATSITYPDELQQQLELATSLSGEKLTLLDHQLGKWYGEQIKAFVDEHQLEVDFIASHGHTVFHQPDKDFTLQIGNGWAMYQQTGIAVISDFRSKDVALGGQGAPLAPVGDKLLFSEYDYCINLGGISNISMDVDGERIAYDIGPCNMVLNRLAKRLGFKLDEDGHIAREGEVSDQLLNGLNEWAYYKQSWPKSLGYEQVSAEVFPMVDNVPISIKDVLATFTVHAGQQIAKAISSSAKDQKVLITGGGAYNSFLIEHVNALLPDHITVEIPDSQLLEFKEAIIFGFLGVLKVRGEANCLASVTGASADSCGGVIYQ